MYIWGKLFNVQYFHLQASLWYTDKLILNFGKPLHNIAEEFQTSILKGDLSLSSLDVRFLRNELETGQSLVQILYMVQGSMRIILIWCLR